MALVVFNNKLVAGSNGLVSYGPTTNTYFMLDITAIQSGAIMQLSELEFYDANGIKLNVVYVTGTQGTASDYGNEDPTNMFDGRTDTKWCVRHTSAYVVGKVAGHAVAASYRMATANDTASYSGRNPKNWTISTAESTTDIISRDSSLWTVIDNRSNDTTMGAMNETFYTFTIPSE